MHNNTVAKELAERAGKDAEAIKIVSTWTASSTPNITDVARNSINGNGNVFALGPGGDYDGGWVQFARENTADFYFTHPEISKAITELFPIKAERDAVFWSINKAALNGTGGPIEKGMDFLYQIDPTINILDKKAIEVIWTGGDDSAINIALQREESSPLLFRIRELKVLYENGYGYFENAGGNIVLSLKPILLP